jgi:hypothetical protein
MGKKNRRKEKRKKEIKTEEERKREMDEIKAKLLNLGLEDKIEGIDIFYKEAEKFIRSGESWSGKIKIPGAKRILDVILTSNKRKESTAALLYNEHV